MTKNTPNFESSNLFKSLLKDSRLIAIIFASFMATLSTNIPSAVLPAMADGLMVSDSRIGLVLTISSLFAMVFVPISGVLADLYGRKTILLPAIGIFGIAGTLIAFVTSFEAVLILRAIQGICYGAIMPLTVTLLGDFYTGAEASAAQGFRVSVNGIGSSIIPAVAGVLSAISWNYPFLIYLLFIPVFILVTFFLPEQKNISTNTTIGRDRIQSYITAIRNELTEIDLGILVFGGSVRDFIRYGLLTFIPLFAVRVFGASFAEAGALLSVRGVVYIVMSPLSGTIVGRFSRKRVLIGSLGLYTASVFLMPFSPNIIWVGILFGLYTVGDSIFSPVIKDSVTALSSADRRGGVVSSMNLLKYAGQTVSPVFFGFILSLIGFNSIFFICSSIAMIYGLMIQLHLGDI